MVDTSAQIKGGPSAARGSGPIGDRLRRWGIGPGKMSPEERRKTLEQLYIPPQGKEFRQYLRRFVVLLSASVLIAWCGLRSDSTAVVIGAMLVAPLMEPILAMSAALVMSWPRRFWRSALVLLMGCIVTVGITVLMDLVIPHSLILPQEVLARTRPTLLDLGVALGAGIAAGYAVAKRISAAAPGVAVAVALVPPLVTVGILLAEQRFELAINALLLFGTNLATIVLAATVILLLSGFAPVAVRKRAKLSILAGLTTSTVAIVGMAIPLAFHTESLIYRHLVRDAVFDSIDYWGRFTPQEIHNIALDRDVVVIDISGDIQPRALRPLAEEIASRVGEDVKIRVRWAQVESAEVHGDFKGERRELRRVLPRTFDYIH